MIFKGFFCISNPSFGSPSTENTHTLSSCILAKTNFLQNPRRNSSKPCILHHPAHLVKLFEPPFINWNLPFMSCSSKHTTMVVGAARFSKHSWTYLLQVFNIAKHKGHLFEHSNLRIPLLPPFLHNQVKISISSSSMPWYALDRLHDADSNEC